MQIRAALNQQTAIQFRQYAEQQSPGNVEQVGFIYYCYYVFIIISLLLYIYSMPF